MRRAVYVSSIMLLVALAACQNTGNNSVPGTLSRTETVIGADGALTGGVTTNGIPALVIPQSINGSPLIPPTVVPSGLAPAPSALPTVTPSATAAATATGTSSSSGGGSSGGGGSDGNGGSGSGGAIITPSASPVIGSSPVPGFQNLHGQTFTIAGNGTAFTAGSFADPTAYDSFGTSTALNKPGALTVDPANGIVYLADSNAGLIRTISANTNVTTRAGGRTYLARTIVLATTPPFTCATTLTANTSDQTWKGFPQDYGGPGECNNPNPDGTNTDTRYGYPLGIARDQKGDLYVADSGFGTIRKITISTNGDWTTTTYATGFGRPWGITCDNSVYPPILYVADQAKNCIFQVPAAAATAPPGTPYAVTTGFVGSFVPGFADGRGTLATFNAPIGVAIAPNGSLFVTDSGNNAVRRIDVNQQVSTLAGSGLRGWKDGSGAVARFWQPAGLDIDTKGNLFVADSYNHCIRMVDPTGTVSTIAGVPGSQGYADGANGTALFNTPYGVTVDGFGNLYVADTYNHRVRQIIR